MCKASPQELTIIKNIKHKSRESLAGAMGITGKTLSEYISRIKRKRKEAKNFLSLTDPIKSELYPKRTGE